MRGSSDHEARARRVHYDPDFATNENQNLYRVVRPGAVRYDVAGAPSGAQILATKLGDTWTLVANNLRSCSGAANQQWRRS